MEAWLKAGIEFSDRWLKHQAETMEQPGCSAAIAHRGEIVFAKAYGHADLSTGEKLTPRHRFRIASHSKTFTAAGIMKLREQQRLSLDDPASAYVKGLHSSAANVTIAELLSHAGGIVRDGADSGQFADRIPYKNRAEILAELAKPQPVEAGTRFKYSNHGYALLGLIIEAVAREPYVIWISREVIRAAGLGQTSADMPAPMRAPFAKGHSIVLSDRSRRVVPGDAPCNAVAPAAGFVSTPSDIARFFASLSPGAKHSILTSASRRAMIRRHHVDREGALPWHYGLGIMSGPEGDWEWFGHSGSFQGSLTRTLVIPSREIAISVMSNSLDGLSGIFAESILGIMRIFAARGAPTRKTAGWTGQFWSPWGAAELVPVAKRILVAAPGLFAPLANVPEIEVLLANEGRIVKSSGYGSPGEPARVKRIANGKITELWLGGAQLLPRKVLETRMAMRYPRKAKPVSRP